MYIVVAFPYPQDRGVTKPQHPTLLSIIGLLKIKNRTLKEMINFMLVSFGAPLILWEEALLTTNQGTHKKLGLTLFELWYGRPPAYRYLKI